MRGLSASVIVLLGSALPRDCVVYTSDLMLYVAKAKLSTYADASVVSGTLETMTVKRHGKLLGEAVINPVVIVEVLSDATERYDREEKFSYYRTLPSLKDYVLVSQDEHVVEVWRPAAGSPSNQGWRCEKAGAGGVVTIHGCTIEVDAVYGTRA